MPWPWHRKAQKPLLQRGEMFIMVRRREWEDLCGHVTVMNREMGELRDAQKECKAELKVVDAKVDHISRLTYIILGVTVLPILAAIITWAVGFFA